MKDEINKELDKFPQFPYKSSDFNKYIDIILKKLVLESGVIKMPIEINKLYTPDGEPTYKSPSI